jgi:hypothetical protein
MQVIAEWQVGQMLWSFIWFTMFFLWIWLVVRVFADIFRDHSLSGVAKTLWILFVIFLPFLGVFVYLIARGSSMAERDIKQAQDADAAMKQYIRTTVDTTGGASAEIEKLAALKAQGVLTDEEFQAAKAKALG